MVPIKEDKNVLKVVVEKWSNMNTFLLVVVEGVGWEHESAILLLVVDLLFGLMYVGFHVLLTFFLTSVSALQHLAQPCQQPQGPQGRRTL